MKREDIKPGDVIVLNNNNDFRIIQVDGVNYVMRVCNYHTSDPLSALCDSELNPVGNTSAIKSIYRKDKLIWTKPIEMTIAEIEKILKLTPGSLRIKD